MLSFMTMEVLPGVGLGPFQIGDTLWHVLDFLRSNKHHFPKVELEWNPEEPSKSAVSVHLIPHIILYFPPSNSQRLQLIKIPSLPKSTSAGISLTYETQVIAGGNVALNRASVGRVLGPTFDSSRPSTGDGKNDSHFPGISFGFTSSGERRDSKSERREDHVESIAISQGCGPDRLIPEKLQDAPALEGGLERCTIEPGLGVTLGFYPRAESIPLEIIIGKTTGQDLLLDLGPPLRKFWKQDERMQRMWGKPTSDDVPKYCFWNYFQHGLDFLVDESEDDGTVKKIVVHSNIPGTPLFQRYARCPWSIASSSSKATPRPLSRSPSRGESLSFTSTVASLVAGRSTGEEAAFVNGNGNDISDVRGRERREAKRDGAVDDKEGKVMLLDRVGEGGLDGVIGVGTSRLIGLHGMVLEEEEHGGIGTVTVF